MKRWILAATWLVASGLIGSGCNCPNGGSDAGTVVLEIIAPVPGAAFGLDDDTTGGALLPNAIGVTVTVVARSAGGAPLSGVLVEVSTNGGAVTSAMTDAAGEASFADFPLDADDTVDSVVNQIEAFDPVSGASDVITVTTDITPPLCNITSPKANAIIGCSDDLDGNPLNGIQVDIEVSSDAGNGQPVLVTLNGVVDFMGNLTAGSVSFGNATLTPGQVNDIAATCVDFVGNEGTGSISVDVQCTVPTCEVTGLVPSMALYALDDSVTAEYVVTGLSAGAATTVQILVNGATVATGPNTGTSGAFVVTDVPWTDGCTNDITCVATEGPDSSFPVLGPPFCADLDVLDPAPTFFTPMCGTTFFTGDDANPGVPGFQVTLGLLVCCVEWNIVATCPGSTTQLDFSTGPPDPNCSFLTEEVTLEDPATCSLVATCIDDSMPMMTTSSAACDFTVSPDPVLNITVPAPADTTFGIADDLDPGTPGCQIDFTVTGTGFSGTPDICLVDDATGTSIAGMVPLSMGIATFSGADVASIPEAVGFVVRAEECSAGISVPDTLTVTCDLTPPPAVGDLSCAVTDVRDGQLCCSWTVPPDTDGLTVRWGADGGAAFDYDTAYAWTETYPAGTTGTLQTECFTTGPRVGDVIVAQLRGTDAAGNESGDSNLWNSGGPLLPNIAEGTSCEPSGSAERFGSFVTGGDFDNDGNDDLAVGAPEFGGFPGRIYIYFGAAGVDPDALLTSCADIVITGGGVDFLGASLTSIGDWDGDGSDDLAFASPLQVLVGGVNAVHILLGSTIATLPATVGFASVPTLRVEAPASYLSIDWGQGFLAQGAVTGGDLDGDMLGDLIFGVDDDPTGFAGADFGSVYVVLGTATLDPTVWDIAMGSMQATDADVILTGLADGDSFGTSVAYLGPIAAGGTAAFAVGAPQYAVLGGGEDGYAAVFDFATFSAAGLPFAGDVSDAVATFDAPGGSAYRLGVGVAAIGDFSGTASGYGGIAIGGDEANPITSRNGAVFLFRNSGSGLTSSSDVATDADVIFSLSGSFIDARFGLHMDGGPMVSGSSTGMPSSFDSDGLPDLIVPHDNTFVSTRTNGVYGYDIMTPPGTVLTLSDMDFAWPVSSMPGTMFGDDIGDIEYVGDLNGDGYLDVVVGFPLAFGGDGGIVIYY